MLKAKWIDSGREPKCAPDPAFPDGKDVDASNGERLTCSIDLQHPTPRCGYYVVECDTCDFVVVVTTAGRPDDPRSVMLPCQLSRIQKH
jgi:hypothetical protein